MAILVQLQVHEGTWKENKNIWNPIFQKGDEQGQECMNGQSTHANLLRWIKTYQETVSKVYSSVLEKVNPVKACIIFPHKHLLHHTCTEKAPQYVYGTLFKYKVHIWTAVIVPGLIMRLCSWTLIQVKNRPTKSL